jgi:hypothetical protein
MFMKTRANHPDSKTMGALLWSEGAHVDTGNTRRVLSGSSRRLLRRTSTLSRAAMRVSERGHSCPPRAAHRPKCGHAAQAQFTYTVNDGYVTITGYSCPDGPIVIPGMINGLPVAVIGFGAFENCDLTSVTIPDSVITIGPHAFASSSLTSVAIPSSVRLIGDAAFEVCRNLTTVTIDNSPTSIGERAFNGCRRLTDMALGDSVTRISREAFTGCTNLTDIRIPASVSFLGSELFRNCTRLSTITVEAGNPFYSSVDGVLFNANQTTVIEYPPGKGETYTIPTGVTRIGEYAFAGRTGLASVTIPSTVTHIDDEAFRNCTSLTSVTIPGSVTRLGEEAFENCTSLTAVYFLGNAPSLDDAFYGANNVTVYYLPGTTGWGPTVDGRPAVLWNPQAQTADASFGVRTNQFGFTITGSSDLVIVVEACADLANRIWTPVGTNILAGGSAFFSDPAWRTSAVRFYRLRSP